MDGSAVEHSDSDSGESWTLLESGPAYGDDAPDFADHPVAIEGYIAEKDEDTDGISIISDSEPESSTPCELTYDRCAAGELRPAEPQIPELVSLSNPPVNNNDDHKSVGADADFLGDNGGKLKTYVHKRNKRLSTMLNIIVLGSVITAAGVALGHMWGARHDCAAPAAPAVNKILSNLYRLQEENAYLRAKLRDLTLLAGLQQRQRGAVEPPTKHKCKKVFEESLAAGNADSFVQCVDDERAAEPAAAARLLDAAFERELLGDLDKLKNVYRQNKSWLDEEIAKRLKQEEQYVKKSKSIKLKSMKSTKVNRDYENLETESSTKRRESESLIKNETILNVTEPLGPSVHMVEIVQESAPGPRVTYADSLKSDHKVAKRETSDASAEYTKYKNHIKKRKSPKMFETISEISITEDEPKKDDRYVGPKLKPDRGKKNDRPKTHKKQKRRNKYEQWEMKGGYLKDYDEVSVRSALETEASLRSAGEERASREPERGAAAAAEEPAAAAAGAAGWQAARAAARGAARRRLELQLFGAPAADWYFRRGARRQHCRAEPAPANHTYKRLAKRALNYKTKH